MKWAPIALIVIALASWFGAGYWRGRTTERRRHVLSTTTDLDGGLLIAGGGERYELTDSDLVTVGPGGLLAGFIREGGLAFEDGWYWVLFANGKRRFHTTSELLRDLCDPFIDSWVAQVEARKNRSIFEVFVQETGDGLARALSEELEADVRFDSTPIIRNQSGLP